MKNKLKTYNLAPPYSSFLKNKTVHLSKMTVHHFFLDPSVCLAYFYDRH